MRNNRMKHLPNALTVARLIMSLALMFIKTFSFVFYLLYFACGITDVLDGFVARKFHLESKMGAMLDSIADLFFFTVIIVKLTLNAKIMPVIFFCAAAVLVLKIINTVYAVAKYKKIVMLHTLVYKIAGIMLFCTPLAMRLLNINYCFMLCICVAFAGAVNELHLLKNI